jgi:hypothetical protein
MAIVLQMAFGVPAGPEKKLTDKEKKKRYKRMSRTSPDNPEGKTKVGQVIEKIGEGIKSIVKGKPKAINTPRVKKGGSVSIKVKSKSKKK